MSLDGAVWLIFGALTAGFLVSISDYEVGLFGYTLLLVPVLLYLVARSPIYGIFVLVPLSIFVSPAPQEIGYLEWVYISVFGLTLLAWVARLARWRLQRNRFTLPILSIYILILLSLFLRDPQGDFGRWIRGALPFLNLAMFFVVLSGVNKIEDVRWVVWIFHASAVLLILFVGRSVSGVLGHAAAAGDFVELRASLERGSFGGLSIMLPSFLFALWASLNRSTPVHLLSVVGLLGVISVTLLRSALVIVGLMFMLAMYRLLRNKKFLRLAWIGSWTLVVTIIFLVGYLSSERVRAVSDLLYTGYSSRFAQLLNSGNVRSLETREVLWHASQSPFLGRGLDFEYSYDRGQLGRYDSVWSGGYTHNILTYFFLTFGLVGVGCLTWLVLAAIGEYRDSMKQVRGTELEAYSFAAGMGLLALALYANVQSAFRSVNYLLIFSVLAAMLVRMRALATRLDGDQAGGNGGARQR